MDLTGQMQRDYEEFKVRINALVARSQKVPEEGWTMQDGTPWPGNSVRDHPGMIQVGHHHVFRICSSPRLCARGGPGEKENHLFL